MKLNRQQDKYGELKLAESNKIKARSHALIPGGAHTYAKGDDQFPELSPGFIARGKGCHVWDVDGNEYIEYGMGCRAVALGHAFEPVIKAVQKELPKGTNFSRPSPIEVRCAEDLLGMIEGAEMAKFSKDGSSTTTAAVKLARAVTGRDMIAICGDHPFFATNDWFIGTTALDAGIPDAIKNLTVKFSYNDIASVRTLFAQYPGRLAGLIMEPAKYEDPKDGFLHQVQKLCKDNGTVFILDEMITGFRWDNGGAQKTYDVVPDLSTFGKALANGFSVSALVGKEEIMRLGGLDHDAERVFLLSTTHGAECHSLAAAIATMRVYREEPVIETLFRQGERLASGLNSVIATHGLQRHIKIIGKPCSLVFDTLDEKEQSSQAFRSLLMQELIRRGILGQSLVISYSHSNDDVDKTIDAFDDALPIYKDALSGGVEHFLV
ncbi:MAG: glutamate-1-semialdehyde 2,1-aminomutase, partial [Woeseia sp.]|nr:glutamate-1-semialdehyde 2,1-aminomutase [Woeseia sp.]